MIKVIVSLPNGNRDLGNLIVSAHTVTKTATERGYEMLFAQEKYANKFVTDYQKAGGSIKANGHNSKD